MCSLVYLRRFWNIGKVGNFTFMWKFFLKSAKAEKIADKFFKQAIFLAVEVGLLLLMLTDNFLSQWLWYQPLVAPKLLETYIMLIFSVELNVINAFLCIYCRRLQNLEGFIQEKYEDFYKIPIAECRKLENGDFLVVGWIRHALESKNSSESIAQIREEVPKIVQLLTSLESFFGIFAFSSRIIFSSFTGHLFSTMNAFISKPGFNQYCNMLRTFSCIFIGIQILQTRRNSHLVKKRLHHVALTSYRLYLDLPVRTVREAESDLTASLLLIYKMCFFFPNF
ncbi:uncharacterized protein LOC109541548 [Dendroctonus ponderosae]|uniref:uncharacterized protein LOC109541548 n=1 Tax=Dendroctonus ponderosae TaxID=77166 RepID=UPI0020359570|nr:uncharacterized protein LOC109541548 [Dendroctonus ponderosae]KAH1028249.1 hypothetical protein HUJ05_001624 [Dendroctonus ponderosae]